MLQLNLKFVASPVPGIIAIGVLRGVATNLGEQQAVWGRGWYTVRKSVGEFL